METLFEAHEPFSSNSTRTSEPALPWRGLGWGRAQQLGGNGRKIPIFPPEETEGCCCVLRGGTPGWDGIAGTEQLQIPGFWGQQGREIQSWAVRPIPSCMGSAGGVGTFII